MQRTEPEGVAMRWLSVTPRAVYHVSGPLALCHIEREVQRLLQSWFKTTCIVFYNNNSAGLGLGLGLDPSVISRLFCVGRSPELVISRPFGALPSGCWWPTDTVLVIYRLRWWSTDFCWWVPVIAGDLPPFAGEFPSAGDLPTFWWSPDFFLVMSWPLVISRLFLPLLTLLVLDHPNYGWIDWNFHKMLNNVC